MSVICGPIPAVAYAIDSETWSLEPAPLSTPPRFDTATYHAGGDDPVGLVRTIPANTRGETSTLRASC